MAKCDNRDLQKLLKQRPDAKNVNNWHWSEKNATSWSRKKLSQIFNKVAIEDELTSWVILEMTKCEGDAVVNNRKSKLLVFYDWTIELKWVGSLKTENSSVEGTIEICNFSDDQSIKDIEIQVHSETNGDMSKILRDVIQTSGVKIIIKYLEEYVTSLKEEFAKTLILPATKNIQENVMTCNKDIEKMKIFEKTCPKMVQNYIFKTCEISFTESFKCTAQEFYLAMTVKELVESFANGSCILEPEEGGKFELFDGNVQGYFTKFIPYRLIKQKWRFRTWPEKHFSDVSIDIIEKSDFTEVNVSCTDVPKDFSERMEAGWRRFYWNSMKRSLGFGSFLI